LAVLPPASPLLHHSGHSPFLPLAETRSLPPSHWLDGGGGGAKREGWPAVSVSHFPTRRAVRATFTPAPGRRLLQETLTKMVSYFNKKTTMFCMELSYRKGNNALSNRKTYIDELLAYIYGVCVWFIIIYRNLPCEKYVTVVDSRLLQTLAAISSFLK